MNRKKLLKIPINKGEFESLRKETVTWFCLLASLALTLTISFWIILHWQRLPPQIPLFFSRPWGKKQLALPSRLWLLPSISLAISGVNLILTVTIFKKEVLVRRILAASSLAVSVLISLTIYKIISLIT